MLTVEETESLRQQFKNAKIRVLIEKPDKEGDLLIDLDRNERINILPGKVDLKVFPDPAHRQIVVWADEKAHDVERVVETHLGDGTVKKKTIYAHVARAATGHRFPVRLPEGTTYEVKEHRRGTAPSYAFQDSKSALYMTVVAHVPTVKQTFLMGSDEKSQFVCGLPKRVKSVSAAHEALRPKGVPKDSPRQGEWFFVPATAAELKKITADLTNEFFAESTWLGSADGGPNMRYWRSGDAHHNNEDDTSHVGTIAVKVRLGKTRVYTLFVRGYIIDDRSPEGRTPRHEPLWLNDWHKVVRNLEMQYDSLDSESWD